MSHEDALTSKQRQDNPADARCSFCGKWRLEGGPMVEGPSDVYICVACVRAASKIADDIEKSEGATCCNEGACSEGARRST